MKSSARSLLVAVVMLLAPACASLRDLPETDPQPCRELQTFNGREFYRYERGERDGRVVYERKLINGQLEVEKRRRFDARGRLTHASARTERSDTRERWLYDERSGALVGLYRVEQSGERTTSRVETRDVEGRPTGLAVADGWNVESAHLEWQDDQLVREYTVRGPGYPANEHDTIYVIDEYGAMTSWATWVFSHGRFIERIAGWTRRPMLEVRLEPPHRILVGDSWPTIRGEYGAPRWSMRHERLVDLERDEEGRVIAARITAPRGFQELTYTWSSGGALLSHERQVWPGDGTDRPRVHFDYRCPELDAETDAEIEVDAFEVVRPVQHPAERARRQGGP